MSEDHDHVEGLEDIHFIEGLDDVYMDTMVLMITTKLLRVLTKMTTITTHLVTNCSLHDTLMMTTELRMVLMMVTR